MVKVAQEARARGLGKKIRGGQWTPKERAKGEKETLAIKGASRPTWRGRAEMKKREKYSNSSSPCGGCEIRKGKG